MADSGTKKVGTPSKRAAAKSAELEAKARRLKWLTVAAMAAIAALFLYLRLRNIGSLVAWDEAQLSLAIRSKALGLDDIWALYARIHPPVYLGLGFLVTKLFGYHPVLFKLLSVAFATGTLVLTYFIAKELFGRAAGLLSALALAVLPASTVMDTWIKQDSAAVFFICLTIFLFLRNRAIWAGVSLGAGLLTKETAVLAIVIMLLFAASTWSPKRLKAALIATGIGALASFWWYVWLSTSRGHFWRFFLTGTTEGSLFTKPFWFFFAGLKSDVGLFLLAFALLGVGFGLYRVIGERRAEYSLPIIWFLAVYLLISISSGKPYWMVTAALPGIAMLCGVGASGLLDTARSLLSRSERRRAATAALVCAFALGCLFSVLFLDYLAYNGGRAPQYWDYAREVEDDASYVAERDEGRSVVAVMDEDTINRDAVFAYYVGAPVRFLESDALTAPDLELLKYASANDARWLYLRDQGTRQYVSRLDAFTSKLKGELGLLPDRESPWGYYYDLR